jgi:toxin-antitoxin system PIN domain toxin
VVLLDVNALVALAWDSHVHHVAMRRWFARNRDGGWATCPITESGFVRVSANARALPSAITVAAARDVMTALRRAGGHRFLSNDVSITAEDVPPIAHHRDVTDTVLLTVARRNGMRLVTFDAGIARRADDDSVELLTA